MSQLKTPLIKRVLMSSVEFETTLTEDQISLTFPPKSSITSFCHIGEYCILLYWFHSHWIRCVWGSWCHAKEASFWINCSKTSFFIKFHPGNVIPNTFYLPSWNRGCHHSQVCLTTSTWECSRDVLLLSFGVGYSHNLMINTKIMNIERIKMILKYMIFRADVRIRSATKNWWQWKELFLSVFVIINLHRLFRLMCIKGAYVLLT